MKIAIKSKIKNYSLEIIDNVLDKGSDLFSSFKFNRLFYFIDKNFYKIYENKLKKFIKKDFYLLIGATEYNKSFLNLPNYFRELIKREFRRNDILVTFGGGILQDISGFVASTLYRGVRWLFLPTTLLAQADSCVGSKTSINFDESKNLVGTFYPPDRVYIDIEFCKTLSKEYFNSGVGEIIKFHLMSDKIRYARLKKFIAASDLLNSPLLKEIILSTLEIKKTYFENDEFDTRRRNLLNYGHCFGHALESATNFAICHGEAVIVGMGFANLLSLRRGFMTQKKYEEFEGVFCKYYPRFDFSTVKVDAIIEQLKHDKKRISGDLTMILASDIGKQYKYDDIKESEIRNLYCEFAKKYPKMKS